MIALLKKEINSFLGSLLGYVVILVFLSAISLFMWILPGEMNVLDDGYARLDTLFVIAPWIFLFLIPAITMRSFAEEKRTGTLEILLTHPLTDFQIIAAKYLSAMVLVVFSLVPTIIYYFSIYFIGSPPGNIDSGAAFGSYIGLFFIAASFVSIGIFISASTDNQVISFIVSALLSFIFFVGFDSFSAFNLFGPLDDFLLYLSISRHYTGISRGIVDSRDIFYFLSITAIFFLLVKIVLETRKNRKRQNMLQFILLASIVILLNFLSTFFYTRIDLTAEKRFSLTDASKTLLKNTDDNIFVKIYLDGDLPAGFRRLKRSTQELLDEFRVHSNGNFDYEFINPSAETDPAKRNAFYKELMELGLQPTTLQIKEGDKNVQRIIFPGAILTYREKEMPVELLQNQTGAPPEIVINNSVELLEYGFAFAIKKLIVSNPDKIAFLEGHGEYNEIEVRDITLTLSGFYDVSRVRIGGKLKCLDGYKAVVAAGPDSSYNEKDKFILDQYIMRGGRVLWLLDGVSASLDSLMTKGSFTAIPKSVNLEDMLFRYGVRVNTDLIQDVQAASIPINTAVVGNQPQWELRPWIFFPLVMAAGKHPIVANLDLVKCDFTGSLDTVGGGGYLRKTALLVTSAYTRVLNTPVNISLHLVNRLPEEKLFNKRHVPVAILIEGSFESAFKNRLTPEIQESGLIKFKEKSAPTAMVVVSDGDIIKNQVNRSSHTVYPLGYDRYTDRQYGNKTFLLNVIDYLCDDSGLISVRSKELKIRLLDRAKVQAHKIQLQAVNSVVPLLLIIAFGIIHNYWRKRRWTM